MVGTAVVRKDESLQQRDGKNTARFIARLTRGTSTVLEIWKHFQEQSTPNRGISGVFAVLLHTIEAS